jgi:hypothetical protein
VVVSSQALTASSTTKLACSGPNGTDLSSTQHYVQDSSRDRTGPPEAISMAGTLFTGMLHSAFLQRFYISTFLSTSCRDPRHSSQKRPPQRPVRGPGLSISLFFGVPHTPFLPTVCSDCRPNQPPDQLAHGDCDLLRPNTGHAQQERCILSSYDTGTTSARNPTTHEYPGARRE